MGHDIHGPKNPVGAVPPRRSDRDTEKAGAPSLLERTAWLIVMPFIGFVGVQGWDMHREVGELSQKVEMILVQQDAMSDRITSMSENAGDVRLAIERIRYQLEMFGFIDPAGREGDAVEDDDDAFPGVDLPPGVEQFAP